MTATHGTSNESNSQSQGHGFRFENSTRASIFDMSPENNNTDKHDIPKEKNKYDKNENCSIKTTGSTTICCGDLGSYNDYNFDEKNTLIVIKYKQEGPYKILLCIYEIDYNVDCHKHLFGHLTKEDIEKYVEKVKSIPKNVGGEEAKNIFDYLGEKKKLEKKYALKIQINPKVDSSQSRVQCSIPNFEETLKDYITYKSSLDAPNRVRGKYIIPSIISPCRSRGGISCKKLKDMCRDNGIKKYSKLRKAQLINFLEENNININKS